MLGLVSCSPPCSTYMRSSTCFIELAILCMCSSAWRLIINWYNNLEIFWLLSLHESSEITIIAAKPNEQHTRATSFSIARCELDLTIYYSYCWLVCRNNIKFCIGSSRIIRNLNYRCGVWWIAQLCDTLLNTSLRKWCKFNDLFLTKLLIGM